MPITFGPSARPAPAPATSASDVASPSTVSAPSSTSTTPGNGGLGDAFSAQAGQAASLGAPPTGPRVSPLGVRLSPEIQPALAPMLPKELSLAAATIHRGDDPRVIPSTIAVTVWVPLPTETSGGVVLDINKKTYQERIPDVSVFSDAGLTRSFLGVDKRKGSPLDKKLDEIIARIPSQPDGTKSLDDTVEFLRANVNDIIKWTDGSRYNDGRAEFEWDRNINVDQGVWTTFSSVAYSPVGHDPVDTGQDYPVVPLEKYIEAGKGYCIQKALLAALVLDKLGFGYRLVNGAVDSGPGRTTGHTWVELEDGRVLDAAWNKVDVKGPGQDGFTDRFRYGSSYRFENQTFPYLRLS